MRLFVTTFLCAALCSSQPDTPAGRVLSAWLDSFNSGDRARITEFAEKYQPDRAKQIDGTLAFRRNTGGFDLVRVTKTEPDGITALVKERSSDNVAELQLKVEGEGEGVKIAHLRLEIVPPPPDLAPKRLTQPEALAALESYIAEQEKKGLSGAVLVARNGKVLLAKAWGLADREKKVDATVDTRFRIGSMNKMFTAVATLQLVDKGKLELDKPVGAYLKEYPNSDVASKVTVRHLLTHTGGSAISSGLNSRRTGSSFEIFRTT
jgi:hypothetical protein